jgi:hypothetical protein
MDVAILLIFYSLLGGDGHSALSALEQTAQSFRFFACFLRVSTLDYYALHSIEQMLIYDWGMLAFVYLPAVSEMTIVKGVHQNKPYAVFLYGVAVKTSHIVLEQEFRNILNSGFPQCIQLKGGLDGFRLLPIGRYPKFKTLIP